MTKKKSLTKNIFLVMFSTIMLVLSIFSIFINVNARKTAFNVVHADTTTTNFYGSSFYVPVNTYYYDMDYTWINASFVNSPGTQYRYVWSDGVNYYYSNNTNQYVLDVATSTWSTKTWTGLTSFQGTQVWSDGVNYYYSNGSNQYVLDVATSTWTTNTWNGNTNVSGDSIWFDGTNYYYSAATTHYVLDVATSTWSTKTWTGLTSFNGRDIAVIDGIIYYGQYVLDVATSIWLRSYWGSSSLISSITGRDMFNIGNVYYYSSYKLDTTKQFIQDYNNTYFISIAFTFIDNVTNYNVYSNAVVYSYDTNCQLKYFVSDKLVIADSLVSGTDVLKIYNSSNYIDYDTFNYSSAITKYYYIPFEMFNEYNVKITACFRFRLQSTNGVSDLNFNSVKFDSGYITPIINTAVVTNNVRYSLTDTSKFLEFIFDCNVYGDTPVYYFGDNSQVITYYLGFTSGRPTNDNYYFRFNPRTYYLSVSSGDSYNAGYIAGDTAGYNRGYSAGESAGYGTGYSDGETAGYNSGYNAGETAGYSSGYTTGYNSGDTAGYYRGYNDGGNAANTYTFLGLISAVIDAPIKAFTGLFNFNLLGVNMVSFITALFTLAVIITIIKKVV